MLQKLPVVAGALLGLAFVGIGGMVLLGLAPESPPPPEGSPVASFMAAFVPTGYLTFVKVLEVLGGGLVAFPKTRNLGLLVLVPILVNIVAFHVFVAGGAGLLDPTLDVLGLLAIYLLWVERDALAGLVHRSPKAR